MIPRPPGGLPLLGHLVPFLRDPLAFLRSLPRYGGLVQIRLGPVSAVVVCDLELTRHVLREDRVFDKGGFLFERVRDFAGNGLVTCPHADHRRQRRYVQPAFRADRIARYTEVMAREARRLAGSWSDGQEVDITAELSLAAGRSLVSTLFTRLPFTGLQETVDDFVLLIGGSYRRMLLPHRLNRIPLPANRRYDAARSRLVRLVDEVVTAYRADPEDRGDLVSTLVAADAGGQALSNAEVTDQVMTIFAAGFDTIANSTVWALHLLAQHPDIADRVRAEVDAAHVDATGVTVLGVNAPEADALGVDAAETDATPAAGTSASVDGLEAHHPGRPRGRPAVLPGLAAHPRHGHRHRTRRAPPARGHDGRLQPLPPAPPVRPVPRPRPLRPRAVGGRPPAARPVHRLRRGTAPLRRRAVRHDRVRPAARHDHAGLAAGARPRPDRPRAAARHAAPRPGVDARDPPGRPRLHRSRRVSTALVLGGGLAARWPPPPWRRTPGPSPFSNRTSCPSCPARAGACRRASSATSCSAAARTPSRRSCPERSTPCSPPAPTTARSPPAC